MHHQQSTRKNPAQKTIFSYNVFKATDRALTPPVQFKALSSPTSRSKVPTVLYLNQNVLMKCKESETQTSKTILELARLDGGMTPDSLGSPPTANTASVKPFTERFLEKKGFGAVPKSKSFVESYQPALPDNSARSSFMQPTKSSQIKSNMSDIQSTNHLIPKVRKGSSISPKASAKPRFESSKKVPYFDQSKSDEIYNEDLLNSNETLRIKLSEMSLDKSKISVDNTICLAVNKLRDPDWRVALKGLADIVEIARVIDVNVIYDYMSSVNQRVIDLLKSPRSHVCRIACQAAGHLFEYVKDTRRPEFDDIVELLLHKTADANKFIRHDANLALDCMVTHINIFNAVRALTGKGPHHKNPLVRCATVRLLVCTVVLAGADFILNPNNNEHSRKRIIVTMARFLEDRNLETRKLAERLYKVLGKEPRFEVYLKKYLPKELIAKIKKNLKLIHKK